MDDIIQLIFFGALILFGLFSSAKKKKSVAPPQPRPRSPLSEGGTGPPGSRRQELGEPREVGRTRPPAVRATLASELLEILKNQGQLTRPEPVDEVEPEFVPEPPSTTVRRSVERVRPFVQSLETTEPLGEASHEEFHDKYKPGRIDKHYAMEADRRSIRLVTARRKLRQAVIMAEVLGPPKGLQ